MSDVNTVKLLQELERDEGLRLKPYRCPAGKLTIGIGRNLEANGVTREEAVFLARNDIARVSGELDRFVPWWLKLDPVRQRVLVNMGFNLGVDGDPRNPNDALTGFHQTLALVQAGNFVGAAERMLHSKWAEQVGPRAQRLAAMMRAGTINEGEGK
jgi:lysozyme